MKNFKMLFFVLFSLILFSSCGANEDAVANESAKKIEFIKTNEMLSFESSLKDWFQAKRENVNNEAKTKLSAKVVQDAKALLNTLGKTDLAKQSTENPELFVRTAMKAYSEKLTEMYHEQKTN